MAAAGWVRWVVGKVFAMPPRQSRQVDIEKGLRVPMGDGVELLADVFRSPACQSSEEGISAPVVLIRSTYGRGGLFGMMASLLAARIHVTPAIWGWASRWRQQGKWWWHSKKLCCGQRRVLCS